MFAVKCVPAVMFGSSLRASTDTTSRPAQTPDSNSQSDEASRTGQANANANKTTMTGCISERNGKYTLMTTA